MIVIKTIEAAQKLPERFAKTLELASLLYNPELSPPWDPDAQGYIILLEEGDDLTDLPYLNKEDDGLYCRAPEGIGWGWEFVNYFEESKLFEIFILCNNEFGITYVLPEELAPHDLLTELEKYKK